MVGRWVVDCGHNDWHTEIHPIQAYVSSHIENDVTVAKVVVTGAWPGGELSLDVWPSPQPSSGAGLYWSRDPGNNCIRDFCMTGMSEPKVESLPPDNPNHLRITFQAPQYDIGTNGGFNDHQLQTASRFAARYRLGWNVPQPSIVNTPGGVTLPGEGGGNVGAPPMTPETCRARGGTWRQSTLPGGGWFCDPSQRPQ